MDDKDQRFLKLLEHRENQKTLEEAAAALIQSHWRMYQTPTRNRKCIQKLYVQKAAFGALVRKNKVRTSTGAANGGAADHFQHTRDKLLCKIQAENLKSRTRLLQMEQKLDFLLEKASKAVDSARPA